MIKRVGELDCFVPMVVSFVETSELGESPREEGVGHYRWVRNEAKTLTGQFSRQLIHQGPAEALGSAIVAREKILPNMIITACRLQREVSKGNADGLYFVGKCANVARPTTRIKMKTAHVA
jgi:hypothetical protein